MQLNKLRFYTPIQGGGNTSDIPYDESIWDGITTVSPSLNSVRDAIESLGYAGHIAIVDDIYGNDFTAKADNILKPFKTHQAAVFALPYGVPCLVITMPGVYSITSAFGFPLRDNLDHLFFNATINITAPFSYGSILIYPSYTKCRLYGKATFNNYSTNLGWAMITPYVQCEIEFEGITFTGARPAIGQLGAITAPKLLSFRNCRFISTSNPINPVSNAGNNNAFGDTFLSFDSCYFEGSLITSALNFYPSFNEYLIKAYGCQFKGGTGNPFGLNAALVLLDYNSSAPAKILVKDCEFKTPHEALHSGLGYVAPGTGSLFYLDNNRFDTGVEGWVRNELAGTVYKMIGNYTKVGASGANPVINTLAGTGIIIDPGIEVPL
jgi:hypothetical protein